MAQEKEKETEKVEESKSNCIIAIIWLIAFIIRTYSTCSRRSKAAWQSPNKWSTLTSFCRAHRLYISSCIVCALAYMNNFHYKVYSRLKLDTKVFKVETRGISVASDLHFYLCYIDGEAEVLNSHVFKVPLLLRILECSNAIIWLTIWWNSNEPSYRRPMSFYLRVVGYAVVFWIVSFHFPDWGYTSRHDFAETQLGFFQTQYWMLQNFGQDSIFSQNMEISYYGGKLKNEYFNVEISISEVVIIMCTVLSLIRLVFVFFVVTFHLDMVYRSPYLEHIIVSAQNLNTIRPNFNAGAPNDTHDDAGVQQQSSAETGPEDSPTPSPESSPANHEKAAEENPSLDDGAGAQQQSSAETEPKDSPPPSPESSPASHEEAAEENPPLDDGTGAQQQRSAGTEPEASPSPSPESSLAEHKEAAEENPPLNPVRSDSEISNNGTFGNLEPCLPAGTPSDAPFEKPRENPESNYYTSDPAQCAQYCSGDSIPPPREQDSSASSVFYGDNLFGNPYKDLATLPPHLTTSFSSFGTNFHENVDPYASSSCPARASTPVSDSHPISPLYENGPSSGSTTTPRDMYSRQRVPGHTCRSSGYPWIDSQREVSDTNPSSSSNPPIQHGPATNTRVAPPRPPRPQDETMSSIVALQDI